MDLSGRNTRGRLAVGADAPAAEAVTVLAVDDQEIFRRALRELIAATPGFEQVGEAASGADAIARAGDLGPDLVLLDVRMPEMDGIETARRLTAAQPEAVVILISLEPAADLPADTGAVAHVRKQDLSTVALRELWIAHVDVSSRRRPRPRAG